MIMHHAVNIRAMDPRREGLPVEEVPPADTRAIIPGDLRVGTVQEDPSKHRQRGCKLCGTTWMNKSGNLPQRLAFSECLVVVFGLGLDHTELVPAGSWSLCTACLR